ncbi:MAG: CocE/NonD family hydrolase [Acidimicrobiales bacterium]|nr:CocE/NonD family hydrolase [Acidimicrobiales bacterium]
MGLRYSSPSGEGVTDAAGRFAFGADEVLTFSIGSLVIGSAAGQASLTIADLAPGAELGSPLSRPGITNRARFVFGLMGGDPARALVVDPALVSAVEAHVSGLDFELPVARFERDPGLLSLFEELGRPLPGAAEARNHLRRAMAGIRKDTNVQIPTRDGSYLLADIYRPISEERYPAIARLSVYGKAFRNGSICDEADRLASEDREDVWFEQGPGDLPPVVRYSETIVSASAHVWVPRGYAVVRIDGRGVGKVPGVLEPFSAQEASDYYDAIEWIAGQSWCDGKVGLYGASYSATIQWNVAALGPPSLRAIMPFASDADAYRDLSYPGGIFNEAYRRGWFDGLVGEGRCGGAAVDLVGGMQAHAFDEPAYYGPSGTGPLSADFSRVTVPVLTAVSQTASLHGRAGFEAFRELPSKHKQLLVVDATYFPFLFRDCLEDEQVFFDRFLKGVEPQQPPAPVRMIMRTGGGAFEWREEPTWPVPGTCYETWFLDATRGALAREAPQSSQRSSYSADADADATDLPASASFLSAPLDADVELAGHFGATLWVSASAHDMDVFVALRVVDADGAEVRYERARTSQAPVTWGCLKVSQRATDRARSCPERPWHTHRAEDRQPLTPDEVVEIEVEMLAATARVRAGHRLRVDVTPIEGPGARLDASGRPTRRAYDPAYHVGVSNHIHTGPLHLSSIRLPVVGPEPLPSRS